MTRTLTYAFSVCLLALLLAVPARAQYDDQPDIVEIATGSDQFETLTTALQAAGLVETLQGDGPFTVFAPTDEAFAALPEGTLETLLEPENVDRLRSILTYHVASGAYEATEVLNMSEIETLQGGSLDVEVAGEQVMIGEAEIVTTDVQASNGVIHVIDAVLLPGDM